MAVLRPPSGTVTFLFTDVEGSTRLWEEHREEMQDALARHDELVRAGVTAHDGFIVKGTGDGVHAAFSASHDAIAAAEAIQRELARAASGARVPLRVRMGVHSGEAELRDGDYYGPVPNRAARLMSVAHGGQILVSDVTAALAEDRLPDGTHLTDLGVHRLRDLSGSLRVFQLDAADRPDRFPALRTIDSFPTNLPAQLSSFVGRDDDVAAVGNAVTESPIVTLTGVGGVGKTRLAVHVAANLLPTYGDGVWCCELAAAVDDESMEQVVAATLGVVPRPGLTLGESVVEFLRGREVLLLLDNCEHVVSAAGRLAEAVARRCPFARVLATSREGLAVEGERVIPVRSLGLPNVGDDLATVTETAAVRLFVERATAVEPGFTLDPTTAMAVVEICRRLDGIPLAIELAAARITTMGPKDISRRLDERFRLLTGGRRTAVERHHTLRATVDWSYELLEPREKIVFDVLGIFVGGFDEDAATAVCGGVDLDDFDVLDALTLLVGKSMVGAERLADGSTRYSLLETLREYARQRLDETGDVDRWRRRHAEHYAEFAEHAQPRFYGQDMVAFWTRVHAELDNLRAAVIWSLDSDREDDQVFAERIVASLASAGSADRGMGVGAWAEQVLAGSCGFDAGRRSLVLASAGLEAVDTGDPTRGRALALEAIGDGLPRSCPSPAMPYVVLSVSHALLGESARAFELLEVDAPRALDELGAGGDERDALAAVTSLWAALAGDSERARAIIEEALARWADRPETGPGGVFPFVEAWVTWRQEPVRARDALEVWLHGAQTIAAGNTLGLALSLLAQLRIFADDRGGLAVLRDAVRRATDISHPQVVSVTDRAIRVFSLIGDHEGAAVLGGVVEEGPLAGLSIVPAEELPDRVAALDRARAALGDAAYGQARHRGASLAYDELVHYLLDALDELIARGTAAQVVVDEEA